MNHKLRTLGAALVAVLAVGAVVVSSASAAGAFTAEAGKTVTGTQINGMITGKAVFKHELATAGGTLKCDVTFHGVSGADVSPELTLTPTYSNCVTSGVILMQVTMNGCHYLLTAGNTVVPTDQNTITATIDIVCPSGNVIDIHGTAVGTNCHKTVPAQNNLGVIELHNRGNVTSMDLEATFDITGITYEIHGQCPNNPAQTVVTNNGIYRGVATIQSATSGVGITVH